MRAPTHDFLLNAGNFTPPDAPGWPKLQVSRNALIALAVVVLHVGMLWLFQSGLLMRTAELLVPVEVLARLIEPPVVAAPAPVVEPPQPAAKAPPPPVAKPIPPRAEATPEKPPQATSRPQPAPQPQAVAEPSPPSAAPNAPTALPAPPQPAPVAAAPAAPLPPAIQPPSSDADYLQNPIPPYPENSGRLREQGTSTIRVLIGADGVPQKAEIGQSSGFSRLDRAAVATVLRWRFVPGKRNGVPEAMWFSVPIVWKLPSQ
jgi:periplasmic protein TonB